MKAIRLGLLVSIVTTLLAGLYFVVYLYRWEMHRAIIAGVVFLAGEVALATTLVLRRIETLRAVEPHVVSTPRVGASPSSRTSREPASALDEEDLPVDVRAPEATAPEVRAPEGATQSQPFPWLGADRFGVFVPILLGAGTIVSGVGWVVEHLARVSGAPSRSDGRFERSLAAIALPTGPLVGPEPLPVVTRASAPTPRLGAVGRFAVFLLIGGLAAVLLTLALLGRTRPDPPVEGTRSVLTMEVLTRNGLDVDLAARSLWAACHVWAPQYELIEMRSTLPGHYVLTLEPALSDQGSRRLLGCLNDGTLERVHVQLGEHTRIGTGG